MAPELRQIVAPGTACFAYLPNIAANYALPRELSARHGTASADMAAPSNLHPTHTAGK
jgi:hypothetical protein